jgi:hypothetical protein
MKTPIRKIKEYDNCHVAEVGYDDEEDYVEYKVVVDGIVDFSFYEKEEALKVADAIGSTFICGWEMIT